MLHKDQIIVSENSDLNIRLSDKDQKFLIPSEGFPGMDQKYLTPSPNKDQTSSSGLPDKDQPQSSGVPDKDQKFMTLSSGLPDKDQPQAQAFQITSPVSFSRGRDARHLAVG